MNLNKSLLIAFVISLIISALIGIFVFLFREFGVLEVRLILTTIAFSGFSLAGLCTAFIYQKRRFVGLSITSFIIDILGFVFSFIVIWNLVSILNVFKIYMSLIILAVASSYISLMILIIPQSRLVKISLYSTITTIFLIALMLLSIIVLNVDFSNQINFRILGVLAVLALLGTIITPIINRIKKLE